LDVAVGDDWARFAGRSEIGEFDLG
jgi:hypothetical protein